ncbi:serine protease inhibitor 27A isoform X2 [Apis florea]|nr:serine protease inhibitor 27A isoform X2 [Apis florea]
MKSQSIFDTNMTTNINHEIINHNKNNDFVPYQGERFNIFDWTFFKSISKKYSKNVILSPISLKIALVLLYEGAQGETAYELANTLQLPGTRNATRKKFSNILQSLQTNYTANTLNIGTRIYIDSNISVRQQYEANVKIFYNTDVIIANLSDAQPVVKAINSWVSNVTNTNIDRIIEDDNSVKNSLMLIVNTIFFKGLWRGKYFSPENTKNDKFHLIDNRTVDTPIMHAYGRFHYIESSDLDAKILRIPYDGQFAIYLLLPRILNGIDQLINKINPFVLTRYVWLMQDLPVDVLIPKFKFDFSSYLEPILRELRIRDIFDDTATLTGIAQTKRTSKRLKVSSILQKVGIEMNENGTIAYVATEIEIGNKNQDETFHANHPFLFYIEDESSGTIIYIGKIMNPLDTMDNIKIK